MEESEARLEDKSIGWMAAWVGLACCFVSKEAVRYTALWTFELKSPLLMATILAFVAVGFALMAYAWAKWRFPLWDSNAVVFGLAALTFSGMVVHVQRANGVAMPGWVVFLSFIAIESSLLLLVVYAQYLLQFPWQERLSAFIWGVIGAGAWQIVLVAVSVGVARWAVALSALLSAALLVISRQNFRRGKASEPRASATERIPQADATIRLWPRFSLKDALLSPKTFSGYIATIFLVSIVLMGAYSQWRGQQDGQLVSMLVQVSSGFGFMLTALIVSLLGRSVRDKSLFYVCQTIVLPVALGALYIGTAFQGPGISLSVILFDAAYAAILFVVWISPSVFEVNDSFLVIWAGFLSYKLGWFIGVLTTASIAHTSLSWLGNVAIVAAFLCLVVQSSAFVIGNLLPGTQPTAESSEPSIPPPSLEAICNELAEHYGLTSRERDVLLLLAKGRTASYIARDLVVSEPTVRTHMSHIYRKMGVASHQELLDLVDRSSKETLPANEQAA